MIEILRGALLGLIQGLTEFFPVSSSGHLILVPVLFGWKDQGVAFDTIMHLGTLTALLWVLRREVGDILRGAFVRKDAKSRTLFLQVVVASVPGVLVGGLFERTIESTLRGPYPVALDLALWGVVLFAADRYAAKRKDAVRDTSRVSWNQALIIGFSQIAALLPGTSRSGVTITSGLLCGLDRETAVKFSFLVSIPTIAAAGGYGVLKLLKGGIDAPGTELFTGFVVAFLAGAWAIRFLRSYVSRHTFDVFVVYRLALALFVVAMLR
jgi:undecaprenyl-diphosphatase